MSPFGAPVVVGVDGSEASLAALRWAAEEAAAHHAPLIAVRVLDPRPRRHATYAGARCENVDRPDPTATLEQEILRSGVSPAKRIIDVGVPSVSLVRRAIGARMLVLGHADHHRRRRSEDASSHQGPALGSVARACVARATCPVVVVPIPARSPARGTAVPAPRQEQESQGVTAIVGARAIYPKPRPIPVAHH
jgi:nucleotide-binding universal stress UspA family protein